ncbi:MAG: 3-hydroxyacyl-CoA dehydrogenase NAD-binding domain-containing protein, partial [Bacteroidota bacterium]
FAMLDKTVKPSAIFASSSSSINPSALIPGGESRQVAGLHFFYPVPLKNIVEITLAPSTSAETRLELESFLDSIKRRYITLEEPDSFILNKIFLDFQVEAFQVVHDGESTFLQMDQLVKKYFFAFGVFDFCDSVGLDTMKSAVVNYTAHYPDRKKYDLFLASLGSLVSAGKLGFKTHEGFHKYPLTEQPGDEPEHAAEIEDHLRQTWICACKKFTQSASVPVDQMNSALEEYFGIELSPFEKLLLNPPD